MRRVPKSQVVSATSSRAQNNLGAVAGAGWRVAVAGALAGALAALLAWLPASVMDAAIDRASNGQMRLVQSAGTLWHGSARLQINGGAQSRDLAALPGSLHWSLRPVWKGLQLELRAGCCTPEPLLLRLVPRWGWPQVAVADGHSRWPAAVLAGLGTPWNTVLLEGQLVLSTQGLSVEWAEGRLTLRGRAQLDALDMASRLSTLKPLGSYRLVFSADQSPTNAQAPASLRLETLSGSLQLTGSGQWLGSGLRFSGVASAVPARQAVLANLLNILGRRQGAHTLITIG